MRFRIPLAALVVMVVSCGEDPTAGSGSSPSYDPRLLVEGSQGTAIVNIPGLPPQRVPYVVKDGLPIHSGDIVVSPAELAGLADPRTTSAGRRLETFRWPPNQQCPPCGAVIPFEIDSSFPATDPLRTALQTAMNNWNAVTPISFTPHTVGSGGDFMKFMKDRPVNGGGQSDTIGRVAGKGVHGVHLAPDVNVAIISHEIGHVIGLYHEQQRTDRANYILVNDGTNGRPNLIINNNNGNYFRYVDSPVGNYGNDGFDSAPGLDFNSIMLYGSTPQTDCGPTTACMTKLDGVTTWSTPQTISAGDADGVTRMYLGPFTISNLPPEISASREVALTSPGGTRVDALAIRRSDNHVIHEFFDSGWHFPPDDFGNIGANGRISAVQSSTGRFDWVSLTATRALTHFWRNPGASTSSEVIAVNDGEGKAAAIARQPNGTLNIFTVHTGNRLYMKTFIPATGWVGCFDSGLNCVLGWRLTRDGLGVTLTGRLSAVSFANGRVDVFASTTSGSIIHLFTTGNNIWSMPEVVATGIKSPGALSVASWGNNRFDVFYVRASDSQMIRRSWDGAWSASVPVGQVTDATGVAAVGHSVPTEKYFDYLTHDTPSDIWQLVSVRR